MRYDPRKRYQSAGQLARELRQIHKDLSDSQLARAS
jgi:hypothetical protein